MGHSDNIGQRLSHDLDAMMDLLAAPFDACDQAAAQRVHVINYHHDMRGDTLPDMEDFDRAGGDARPQLFL